MKNIHVGNLTFSTTGDMLRSLFEQYGPVGGVKIVTDPESGQPRGFRFVAMTNDAEAVKAINALNGTDLEGRTLTVDEARPREDRPRTDRSGGGGGQMKRIYVGNLSSSVTEDVLWALFEVYGAVEGVSIITDRDTGQPRGFAFVAMTNVAEAVKAIAALNRRDLEGGRLSVKEARPRTERPGSGGFERKRW
jgi:RNA recognition motif-containing protein